MGEKIGEKLGASLFHEMPPRLLGQGGYDMTAGAGYKQRLQ